MTNSEFEKAIHSEKPVLVDFYADWCAPCRVLEPNIQTIEQHYGDKIDVLKINTDANGNIAGKMNVFSIPTLFLFQKGTLKWRATGVKSVKDMQKQIDKLLGIENNSPGFFKSLISRISQ